MTTIVTRAGKGSALTHNEVDANFTNLNNAKYESGNSASFANLAYTGTLTGGTGVINIGSGQIYKDASGNVGIGLTPTYKLDVSGEARISSNIHFGSNDNLLYQSASDSVALRISSTPSYLGFKDVSGTPLINGSGGTLLLGTAGTERMRIDSSGNVGIGVTSTSSKLEVYGSVVNTMSNAGAEDAATVTITNGDVSGIGRIAKTLYQIGNLSLASISGIYTAFNGSNDIGGALAFSTQSTASGGVLERMRIDKDGNVGIGTSSPERKFVVSEGSTGQIGAFRSGTDSNFAELNVQSGASNQVTLQLFASVPESSVKIGARTNHPVRFTVNDTERMRIDSSGNVGIGTSSPYSQLDVYTSIASPTTGEATGVGSIRITNGESALSSAGGLEFKNAGDGNGYGSKIQALNSGGSQLVFASRQNSAAWAERMRIHASGGVSIGNTTDSGLASLNVSGSISGGYVALANGTTAMPFGDDNVVRVTPTASATYTTTVPAAGAICVLSILTSGTTSRTITFGTGFKATGTLATGTTSARYFNITFVSDGSFLIEMSRTVAIA
jgi:hypothetical protein